MLFLDKCYFGGQKVTRVYTRIEYESSMKFNLLYQVLGLQRKQTRSRLYSRFHKGLGSYSMSV